jgi:hypothetical protein
MYEVTLCRITRSLYVGYVPGHFLLGLGNIVCVCVTQPIRYTTASDDIVCVCVCVCVCV